MRSVVWSWRNEQMNATRLLTSIAVIGLVVGGLSFSHAQTTTGSVQVVLSGGGKYSLIANPFNTTNNTFAGLFSHLPSGTQLLKWSGGRADFTAYGKVGSGWAPPSAAAETLNPGEAVLVLLQGSDLTNTFAGAVLQGNLTNKILPGFSLVGNMLPDSGPIIQLRLELPNGSHFLKWDRTIQDWVLYGRGIFGGWFPSLPTIAAGEGFFVNASAPFEWV